MYFNCLAELQRTPGDAQAEDILLQWQADLDGYFDEENLLLFAGAVDYAYVTKHLPEWRYSQLLKWIKLTKKQMMRKMKVHDNFERTFYGVAYQKNSNQGYGFLSNANEKTLYNKVKELDEQGVLHTPVYKKNYWYSRSTDLPKVRKKFEENLKTVMDEDYLKRVMNLQNLASAIPKDLWEKCLQTVETACSETALEGLRYWGSRWNIV